MKGITDLLHYTFPLLDDLSWLKWQHYCCCPF